ncbi:IclR family transcriptional regulator C-terminal domain-containing protein [Streptomyces sp. NPDC058274]|jgi:DNA-binding IclR family transcriptional regulator|uniref:IclR family transcriptional regulator domain-containing protein n=1 Tax=Streptomyces sp. NPDC058274 TaxID=3346416 RepID=UPI0036E6D2B3
MTTIPGGSSVAVRAYHVQERLASLGPGPHSLHDIAQACQYDDATTSRILTAGIYRKIYKRPSRGMYQLARPLSDLAYALPHGPTHEQAQRALQELREATDQGLAFLYMKSPGMTAGRQCADMAVGDSDLVELGMTPRDVLSVTRSLRTGASGRAILAYLPPPIQAHVLAQPVPEEAGPGVIRDPHLLKASLTDIREQGYALGYQECMKNWNSIAAPVFDGDSITASILLLRPALQMQRPPTPYIEATKHAAATLSTT